MSVLLIKDSAGKWQEIPTIKGQNTVHVGADAPADSSINVWIDTDGTTEDLGAIIQNLQTLEGQIGSLENQVGAISTAVSNMAPYTFQTIVRTTDWGTGGETTTRFRIYDESIHASSVVFVGSQTLRIIASQQEPGSGTKYAEIYKEYVSSGVSIVAVEEGYVLLTYETGRKPATDLYLEITVLGG